MSDNKPEETDEELDELFSEDETTEEESDESGQKDAASDTPKDLDLDKLKDITGREFKDEEDFTKHYKNLSSYVGKKVDAEEKVEEESKDEPDLADKIASLENRYVEKEFLDDNPDAKSHIDLVKAVSEKEDIPLGKAWDTKVKDLAEAKKAREEESEIGVKSKNRLSPTESKRVNSLAKKVAEGDVEAEESYVKEALGL